MLPISKTADNKRKETNKLNSFSHNLTVGVDDLNTYYLFLKNANKIEAKMAIAFANK